MERNRELVPDSWSLKREKLLTTGLSVEGWHFLTLQKSRTAAKECKDAEGLKGR